MLKEENKFRGWLDKAGERLKQVMIEVWNPWIFTNIGQNAEKLDRK